MINTTIRTTHRDREARICMQLGGNEQQSQQQLVAWPEEERK